MSTAILVAHVHPADPSSEDAFNRWYDDVHIPQVVERVPGVVSASRFFLADVQLLPEDALPARRYLSIYQLDTEDLAGTAQALRAAKPDVRIGLADPEGSALYAHYTTGTLKAEGSSITEGIGQGRITGNLAGFTPDHAYRIPDAEALAIVFRLMREEGLSLGGSSGINVAGAIRLARELGPGHTIVTILCDGAARYASKLFNPAFLAERGLPVPDWLGPATDPLPDWRA